MGKSFAPGAASHTTNLRLLPALVSLACVSFGHATMFAADTPAPKPDDTLTAQASAPAGTAASAPTSAPSSTTELTSVTVTAQRTKQLSQTVPIALTTISGESLKDQGGASMVDLARIVSGLTVRDSGPVLQFNLRGAATIDNTGYHEGVVAVYNDDVYRAASQAVTGRLIDVDRVEVLRGPQGLQFGRNTTGGVVHFLSRQPTRDFDAYFNVGYGNYNQRTIEAAMGGPLTATLSGRVAILTTRDNGWQENNAQQPGQPAPAGGRLNAVDSTGGRFSLLYQPMADLAASLSVTSQHERNTFQGYAGVGAINPVGYNPNGPNANCPSREQLWSGGCVANAFGGPAINFIQPNWKNVSINLYGDNEHMPSNLDLTNVTGKVTYNLATDWTLTSITGYEHSKKFQVDEFDGTTFFPFESYGGTTVKELTQEFRISGTFTNKTRLTTGVYYFNTEWDNTTEGAASNNVNQTRKTKSYAIFGEVAVPLATDLTGKVGLRWTRDNKTISGVSTADGSTDAATDNSSFATGQVGLEWNASRDQMLYVTVAKAQKSGEFGDVNPPDPISTFNPEKVTNIELGQKLEFWNRRARLNTSIYYNKTKNKQLTSAVLVSGSTAAGTTFNIGDVVTKGLDVEFLVKPTRDLELGLNLDYTDTKVESPYSRRRTFAGILYPLDGNRMVGTPTWQVGPSAKYVQALGDIGFVTYQASYKWQSKVYWDITNEPYSTEKPYGLLNGSVRWESANGKYNARLWGTNLLDKEYANLRYSLSGFPTAEIQWGSPRRVGVEVGMKWF